MIVPRYQAETVRLVCATRLSGADFFAASALGRSRQQRGNDPRVQLMLFERNARALGDVYNEAIERAREDAVHLVFIHDDVLLSDPLWPDKIIEGLREFHIIGVAGNRRRLPAQPSWAFVDTRGTWDDPRNLSGTVGHGREALSNVSRYGPSGQRCVLLDGLFLAANSMMLIDYQLRFDPGFRFHFYDMDFCRQAQLRGLAMGTWPIDVMHGSGGAFGTSAWRVAYRAYLDKYGETPADGMPSEGGPAAQPSRPGSRGESPSLMPAGEATS